MSNNQVGQQPKPASMYESKIVKFIVRIPGESQPSQHSTELAAHKYAKAGNRTSPGHWVFSEHENGDVTGPIAAVSDA